jgi:hypothetical protein
MNIVNINPDIAKGSNKRTKAPKYKNQYPMNRYFVFINISYLTKAYGSTIIAPTGTSSDVDTHVGIVGKEQKARAKTLVRSSPYTRYCPYSSPKIWVLK